MAILEDGFQTLVGFSAGSSGVVFSDLGKEKTVTPPGLDGGGPIDTTTMRNTLYRTMAPKQLITLTESTMAMAYDPAVYDEIIAMLNVKQAITITFPDSSTLVFWGYLNTFTPNGNTEGEQPMADINLQPTNTDADDAEIAPVYAAAP